MIRRPPRSTPSNSSAASDVYKRQLLSRSERISSSSGLLNCFLVLLIDKQAIQIIESLQTKNRSFRTIGKVESVVRDSCGSELGRLCGMISRGMSRITCANSVIFAIEKGGL